MIYDKFEVEVLIIAELQRYLIALHAVFGNILDADRLYLSLHELLIFQSRQQFPKHFIFRVSHYFDPKYI